MLTEKQISEIKEHLEKAQNPVFFYDNDADGLCSFLILRRYLGRGKGVVVRSYPDLGAQYVKKAQELNADYVFVLDKPLVSREFVEELDKIQLPMVWIDHHPISGESFDKFHNVHVYNPALNSGKNKSDEPVTYWAYKITGRKEDLWIAMMGCIADHFMPEFSGEFEEEYPDFWGKFSKPFDIYYKTEIGRIAMALNFGMKDSLTHVVQLQNFLIGCSSPGDVFSDLNTNHPFRLKYKEIKKKYDALLEEAKESISGKLVFFDYGGELSISADLSNELAYLYPDKYVVVAYRKGAITNISMRGDNVREILEKVLKHFKESSGGGHKNAVGARIRTENITEFKEKLKEEINKK